MTGIFLIKSMLGDKIVNLGPELILQIFKKTRKLEQQLNNLAAGYSYMEPPEEIFYSINVLLEPPKAILFAHSECTLTSSSQTSNRLSSR